MNKPVYLTTITIVTNKITANGDVQLDRETSFSFGAKESKTGKEANVWHNFLVKFIETLQRVAHREPI